jgi:hypothetical protein
LEIYVSQAATAALSVKSRLSGVQYRNRKKVERLGGGRIRGLIMEEAPAEAKSAVG